MSETTGRPRHPTQPNGDSVGTEAAARVADVLLMFTGGPPILGVTTISRELGLSKAVVHRILRSLQAREFVTADPHTRGYRLGPAAAALGARALRDCDLRSAALPILRQLRDATRETTTLSELVGAERVYLDQVESPQEIKMTVEIGRRFPLHAGASSKAILAFLPTPRRETVLDAPLTVLTPNTIREPDRLRAELAAITRDGVAVSHGERQHGAASVAAPIFGLDDEPVGAISVCGPVDRFGPQQRARYAQLIRTASTEISHRIGSPDHSKQTTTGWERS